MVRRAFWHPGSHKNKKQSYRPVSSRALWFLLVTIVPTGFLAERGGRHARIGRAAWWTPDTVNYHRHDFVVKAAYAAR